jgi:hypothetical protein
LSNGKQLLSKERVYGYPNPAKESFTITSENNFIETITVFDLTGNQVKMLYPNSKNATIDLSELVSGMYIAKYSTKAGTGNIRFAVN